MSYIQKNFLLKNKTAEKLYFDYAEKMPIFDYHCHLSEKDILENKPFENIYQLWLSSDHYKWKLMRNYGVKEEYITGKKSEKEKFEKYCEVLETAFGNPLYHWSQLELEMYFGCDLEINKENADKIWDVCNKHIEKNKVTPQSLIEGSNVKIVFTTNEIFDDMEIFRKIKEKAYKFQVIPAFRADKIMNIEADKYNDFVDKIGKVKSLDELEKVIENRLQDFISVGCVASDIALEKVELVSDRKDAAKVFAKRRKGKMVSKKETAIFKGYFTFFLLKLYAKYNIRSELHIGAMRNNNKVMFNKLGPDTGYDAIAEFDSTKNLSKLMDRLNTEGKLPPMILFNLNPNMNTGIMALIGCFQDSSMRGRIQYGPAWWFLDNKEGIKKQLKDLAANGHLATFIGMLTDSRSFLSYARHYYFRRILCSFLGCMMERNEITGDLKKVGKVVEDICTNNAINYFEVN